MHADAVLVSVEDYQVDDLRKQKTFADDPALSADQVLERRISPRDYSSQAESRNAFAGQLSSSKKVT
jgi:iron complex transport system substrate-binding protein